MIRDAIDKILEMGEPHTLSTVSGREYSDKKLYPVELELRAEALRTTTLTSIINYIKSFKGGDIDNVSNYMVHITSHDQVRLVSKLDDDRKRETLMIAEATGPRFNFGQFENSERFVIALQAMFVNDPETDIALVKKFAGTTTAGSITTYSDDGVTQLATVKQGVASKQKAIVPSPCKLRPYRTFTEVEQPASEFVFRMREGADGVACALFSSDGDAWKREAMKNICEYLTKELEGTGAVVIY